MGDAQSAQRDDRKDAAAAEEEEKVDDAEHKPPQNKGQISEINGKTDEGSAAEVTDPCEDEVATDDAAETEKPLKDAELQLESGKTNAKVSTAANQTGPPEKTDVETTQNYINENFRRFLGKTKVTPKKGSGEKDETAKDAPAETNRQESPRPHVEDNTSGSKSENGELNADLNAAQETDGKDSTISPTLTDLTSNDIKDNTKEMCGKIKETSEETPPDHTDGGTTSPVSEQEDTKQEATREEQPHLTSPCSPDEVIISPIKRFFTTGIFSGLRKKKKPPDDETNEKEPIDTEKKKSVETTEQLGQKEKETGLSAEEEPKEKETEEEIRDAPPPPPEVTDGPKVRENAFEEKSPPTETSTLIADEPESLSLQDKVEASPIKRLLSRSSFKKLTKKQRCRRASDSKLSDSVGRLSDQLMSPPDAAESPPAEASGQEDRTWASFKKLVTPKKHMKRFSLPNEETPHSGSLEEPKPREGDQVSDLSAEESKKRKESSVSWEAVLCGSGRRRSRKTSDSEDEMPQPEKVNNKQDSESKRGAESPGSSKETEEFLTSSPQQAESPSDGDGDSTWKSLKRLVTPQKKPKDEEMKDNIQSSDSEVPQDEYSFSIKKLLPGRKKRKSVEKQERASLDGFDKELASDDEESETPAVVPLSEFDTAEVEVHTQAQADTQSRTTKAGEEAPQKDLLGEPNEPVVFCESLITEAGKGKGEDSALENPSPTTPTSNDESESAELISKHQLLSDIPEETMTTAASVTEEVVKDDTIAEDLIEITSEAITAPEPLDITQADETEMISAVSQLTDSSKTSGNATPVPVDYGIKETEVLLQQVVETISMTPKDVPACLKEPIPESKTGSTVPQIQDTRLKEEATILVIHSMSASSPVNTGLYQLDTKVQFTTTTQTETESEVSNTISIESVSDPTEEFVSVKLPSEEECQVSVSLPQEGVKELQSPVKSQPVGERLSDENEAAYEAHLPECEDSGTTACCVFVAHKDETELPKTDSRDKDSAAVVTDENKKELEEEVKTLFEKETLIGQHVSEEVQSDDQCLLPVVVAEWQELTTVTADIPASETFKDEPKNITVLLTEINVMQEHNSELQEDDSKPERVQVLEVPESVQASALHSKEGRVQSLNMEEMSEKLLTLEIVKDEPEKVIEHLTEVNIQPDYELQTHADKSKHVQVLEVREGVQAEEPKKTTVPLAELNFNEEAAETEHVHVLQVVQETKLDSEEGRAQLDEMEAISEDTLEAKLVTDECEQALQDLTEISVEDELHMDAAQPAIKTSSQILQSVQTATLDSEEGGVHLLEKEITSADIPGSEKSTGEAKKRTVPVTEVHVELENKVEQVEADKPVKAQVSEVLETIPTGTLESEEGRIQLVQKEGTSEEIGKHEPNQTIEHLTEVDVEQDDELQMEAAQPENVQVSQVLQAVQSATLDSETGGAQFQEKEGKSDDNQSSEAVAVEPKKLTVKDEIQEVAKLEQGQAPEVLGAVQAATSQSGQGDFEDPEQEVPSHDISTLKTHTDEPEHVAEPLIAEPEEELHMEAAKPEHLQVFSKETSEDIAASQTFTDESKSTTEPPTEKENDLQVEAAKPEHVQVSSEVLKTVQVATLHSEDDNVQSPQKDIPAAETLSGGPKQTSGYIEVSIESKTDRARDLDPLPGDAEDVSVTDNTEPEVVAQKDEALEVKNGEKTEDAVISPQLNIPEVVNELQTLTAVCISSAEEKTSSVQVQERTVSHALCAEDTSAAVTYEPKREVSEAQVSDEGEKEDEVVKTAAAEQITYNLKETPTPDALTEETSDTQKALVDTVAGEPEFNETTEAVTASMTQDLSETAESGQVEDNLGTQARLDHADMKSVQTQVGTVFEVGITEAKQVTDVNHERENTKEEEVINKEILENLSECTVVQSDIHIQQEVLTEEPKPVVHELSEETQKAMQDSAKIFNDRQAEEPEVADAEISDQHFASRDHDDARDSQGHLSAFVSDRIKSSIKAATCSESLSVNLMEAQSPQKDRTHVDEVELKVDTQFGELKAPPTPTDGTETMRRTGVRQAAVQTVKQVEHTKQTNAPEEAEGQKPAEVSHVAVQVTETPEAAANLDSTQSAAIAFQARQMVRAVQEKKSTERIIPNVQTIEPIKAETKVQSVYSTAQVQETKAAESATQPEDDCEQDVWLDAEEHIDTREETDETLLLKCDTQFYRAEMAIVEPEFETSPECHAAEENEPETQKTGGRGECESEGEDFSVARERPETTTNSVTTAECD